MAYSADAKRGYIPPNEDEALFLQKIADGILAVRRSGRLRFTGFLNDREQALALAQLQKECYTDYAFFGGYDSAERKMLCIHDGFLAQDAFPITALQITLRAQDAAHLTHRDYLGALMGLNIKRECMGDILLGDIGAHLVLENRFANLVQDELFSIGRYPAAVKPAALETLVSSQANATVYKASISSLRLDALLSAMLHISRGNAAKLIQSKAVMINHIETTSLHAPIYAQDIFTVRGHGKYKVCEIGTKTKKDRIFVSYIQY